MKRAGKGKMVKSMAKSVPGKRSDGSKKGTVDIMDKGAGEKATLDYDKKNLKKEKKLSKKSG